jgi:hypothetical protein
MWGSGADGAVYGWDENPFEATNISTHRPPDKVRGREKGRVGERDGMEIEIG